MATGGLYWQTKCVRSPLMQRHPPKSRAPQQWRGLDASHSEAFYSLWISVKSLSRQTALYSAPLFSTLGGHFTSNSLKKRSQLDSAESVWFCRPALLVLVSSCSENSASFARPTFSQDEPNFILYIKPSVKAPTIYLKFT